ncbi:hypothetical protein BGZ61DRAFT_486095 [Ilyonectria robusta]|uniref:uncharacterized protein n=1 Tax=Ilyonectria robusta TaxID=1079257 RepID=UPI001E8CB753|nr:uncharacterized protein BGZ61DRAFT_486095 [Ilyonectria robusta]KAH8658912.1 hypothetical protein BGZ61DRAFT_486095 [Ilyonectria robusta]
MATSDEAVKKKVQFYCSMKLLTLYEGTVRGKGDEELIKAWAKTVRLHPDFSETDFGTWEGHCGNLWGLQYKLQYEDLSVNFSLIAFLRTITYGIRDVVAVIPFSLDLETYVLRANEWGKETFSTKLLKKGVLVTKNRPMMQGGIPMERLVFNDLNDKLLGAVKLKPPPQLKKKGKAAKKKETVDQDLDLERVRSFIGLDYQKVNFTMADNLIKMFKERGFEV